MILLKAQQPEQPRISLINGYKNTHQGRAAKYTSGPVVARFLLSVVVLLLFFAPVFSQADDLWRDTYLQKGWTTYQGACLNGEVYPRVDYLDNVYPQHAPHIPQSTSVLDDNPVKAYCGWVIVHYEYIPGYGYHQVTDTYGSATHYLEIMELGCEENSRPSTVVGSTADGVDIFSGNKCNKRADISAPVTPGLYFVRSYNSLDPHTGHLGKGWRHSFEIELEVTSYDEAKPYQPKEVKLHRPSGKIVYFALVNGKWESPDDENDQLVLEENTPGDATDDEWLYTAPDNSKIHFNNKDLPDWMEDLSGYRIEMHYGGDPSSPQLLSVSDSLGQSLEFAYDSTNGFFLRELRQVDSGRVWHFQQDGGHLVQVDNPDGTSLVYRYDDTNYPAALTEIQDQDGVTLASYSYDGWGRVNHLEYTGGTNSRDIHYDPTSGSYYSRRVTDSLGHIEDYGGDMVKWRMLTTLYSDRDSTEYSLYDYNNKNQLSKHTRNGRETVYENYNSNHNPGRITEASGTPLARATSYSYDSRFFNRISRISTPSPNSPGNDRVTDNTYDDAGNLLSSTVTGYGAGGVEQSSTTYTYNGPFFQLSSIDGPRTDIGDITTFNYYSATGAGPDNGRLKEVVNANGVSIRSNIHYSSTGSIISETRPNGVSLTYTYYPGNDRLETITLSGDGVSRVTHLSYLVSGELATMTTMYGTPSARTTTYGYDATRRLTSITDAAGNSIHYTLNSEGERERVEYRNSAGEVTYAKNFEYNSKGQIVKQLSPGLNAETMSYDAMGNLVSHINGAGNETDYEYDLLNRTKKEKKIGPDLYTTEYQYNILDGLKSVISPNSMTTTYNPDDLDRNASRLSPDSGTTAYSYDDAGNITGMTDAEGAATTYTYDALNRLVSLAFSDVGQNVTLVYDQGTNSKGRLSEVSDATSTTQYEYNAFGQLLKQERTMDGITVETSYTYKENGELIGIRYPSGMNVSIDRDQTGRVTDITAHGISIISNVQYQPFGPPKSWDNGGVGGIHQDIIYNQRYAPVRITAGDLDLTYSYDTAGRVKSIGGDDVPFTAPDSEFSYTYATDSNHLEGMTDGASPVNFLYDGNGNIIGKGQFNYEYDMRHRLVKVSNAAGVVAQYSYDASNLRIKKETATEIIHYSYNQQGQLLSETDDAGNPIRDYIYFNNAPIAVIKYGVSPNIYYYIVNHQGTPRRVVDFFGTVVWKSTYLPSGAIDTPDIETVVNNFRFPGQYYDKETGLHYNWNRYYDPETGRYISADPIGLEGGMNLYSYVENDPVNWVDPWGLFSLGDALDSLRDRGVVPAAGDWRYGRIYSNTQIFDEWLRLEKSDTSWLDKLPLCPKKIDPCKNPDENIWYDPGDANPEHKGATYEMRSRPTPGGHASQCSYDSNGNLMTGIPAGGTADRGAWAFGTRYRHYQDDYRPWKLAEKLNRRQDYYDVRPGR